MPSPHDAWHQNVTAILAAHDPLGLCARGAPRDEYSLETRTIVPRIDEAGSSTELRGIIHQEFVRWFDLELAGAEDNYTAIAEELWFLANSRRDEP